MPQTPPSEISQSALRSILGLVNPAKGDITCVGLAKSTGCRCRNPINKDNRSIAEDIIKALPQTSQNRSELRVELQELAKRTLCKHWHRNQAGQISEQWYQAIVQVIHRINPPVAQHVRVTASRAGRKTSNQKVSDTSTIASAKIEKASQLSDGEDGVCAICFEEFVQPCRTICGHTFCQECITTWLRTASRETCPFDRKPLSESDLTPLSTQ